MIRLDDKHAARLARISPSLMIAAAGGALLDGAEAIAADAKHSILDGAISGPGHVASAPGEPPNADTHELDESIHVGDLIETPSQIQTATIADSDHALYMELGTTQIAERPFMRPAVARNRVGVLERLRSAVQRVIGTR